MNGSETGPVMFRRPIQALSRPLLSIFLSLAVIASTGAVSAASDEEGWTQFHGPGRNSLSSETGLLKAWPEAGPPLLWSVEGLGRGFSSPIIVGDSLYITGDIGEDLVIFAYDLAGELRWKTTNGRAWKRSYKGARSSCSWSDGRLYHMNAHGRAVCLDPVDGREIWAVDTHKRFEAKTIAWGISECLLIDGDRVIVTPGGKKALIAALDKRTGKTLWASPPLRFTRRHAMGGAPVDPPVADTDKAGYASPILFELGGRRLLAGASARYVFCADADRGEILWTYPVNGRHEVIGAMPVFTGQALLFTAPDDFGSRLFSVHADADTVRLDLLWESPVDSCHGSLLYKDGAFYGSGYRRFKPWVCVDAATGKTRYSKDDLAFGSILHADNRLYALSQEGEMALLQPTPEGFKQRGRFTLVERPRGRDVWAHPVLWRARLYLRYHDRLFCYDVKE